MNADTRPKPGKLMQAAKNIVTIAYPVLLVLSSLHLAPSIVKVLLLVAPLTLLLNIGISRLSHVIVRRLLRVAVVVLAIAACLWLHEQRHEHLHGLIVLQENAFLLAMAAVFGMTLLNGGDALCTRFVRYAHETPSLQLLHYSRQLTIVWALFFIASAAMSTLLYFWLSMSAWALYNSVGIPLTAVALFFVENRCQRFFLPREECRTLPEVWRAVRAVQTRQASQQAQSGPA